VPAWITVELDTTPPEKVTDPASTVEAGSVYIADMDFGERLDIRTDVYIQQGEEIVMLSTLDIDGTNMIAIFDATGLSLGSATLYVEPYDDVWNTSTIEIPLQVIEGSVFLLEVSEREFDFDFKVRRDFDFTLKDNLDD
jgi:hypothetical protein